MTFLCARDTVNYRPGHPYNTHVSPGQVDLGAYTVRTTFIREQNASFLQSLPMEVDATNYHGADWHFLEYLSRHGAKVRKYPEYYFIHN